MARQQGLVLNQFDEDACFASPLANIADMLANPDIKPGSTMLQTIRQLIDEDKAIALIRVCATKGYKRPIEFLAQHQLIDPTRALQSLLFCCYMYPEKYLYRAVEALLDAGADADQPGFMSSLVSAAINARKPSVAHLLLDRGAHPDPECTDRMNKPYSLALQYKYDELAERIRTAILAREAPQEGENDPIAHDNNSASTQPQPTAPEDINNSNI